MSKTNEIDRLSALDAELASLAQRLEEMDAELAPLLERTHAVTMAPNGSPLLCDSDSEWQHDAEAAFLPNLSRAIAATLAIKIRAGQVTGTEPERSQLRKRGYSGYAIDWPWGPVERFDAGIE